MSRKYLTERKHKEQEQESKLMLSASLSSVFSHKVWWPRGATVNFKNKN